MDVGADGGVWDRMTNIDAKDKKVLCLLAKDARMSRTQLAKKAGISKSSAGYRLARFRRDGVIRKFSYACDLGRVGTETVLVLLKFNNEHNETVREQLLDHPLSVWVAGLSGNWDFAVEFAFTSCKELKAVLDSLIGSFGNTLSTYETLFSFDVLKVEHLVEEFCGQMRRPARSKEQVTIDRTDASILSVLSEDAAVSHVELAKKAGIGVDAVRYRLKRLTREGVILYFFPDVCLPKLGYTEYLCTMRLKNLSQQKIALLKRRIMESGNVTYAFFDTVSLHLVFVCAFLSVEGMDGFYRSLRKPFADVIERQEYFVMREQLSFSMFPGGLVELFH